MYFSKLSKKNVVAFFLKKMSNIVNPFLKVLKWQQNKNTEIYKILLVFVLPGAQYYIFEFIKEMYYCNWQHA